MRSNPPPPPPQHRRAIALALVALLHAGLAGLLIFSVFAPPPPVIERETILYLTPAQKPLPPPARASAPTPATRPAAPPPLPSYNYAAPAPSNAPLFAAPKNDIERLMQGCAAVTRMTPEDRDRCRFAFGQLPRSDPTADPREKLRDEAYFAAERAAIQAPPRVPCVTMFSRPIGAGTSASETGAMMDTLCAAGELGKLLGR